MKTKHKFLLISQHYAPEPNFVTNDIAKYISNFGSVTVVTAHPNYPFGQFYKSVRTLWPTREVEHQITIWRLPFFPDHSSSKIRRALSYLSFAVIATMFVPFVSLRPSAVFVYQSPFTVALASLWLKLIYRSKIYYICADLWPESLTAAGVGANPIIMKMLYLYSRWINRRSDFLICSTRGTQCRYISDGISRDRTAFVPVWVDGIPQSLGLSTELKRNSRSIVYAGNIGTAQGLDVIIETAKICRDQKIDVCFDIYGNGMDEPRLRKLAEQESLSNVTFHGRVSPQEAFEAAKKATAILIHLNSSPLFKMTLPSKLASAFAAGGIILAGVEGEAEEWVRQSGAGFTFSPGNASQLVGLIKMISQLNDTEYERLTLRALDFYRANYEKNRLLKFYEELLATNRTDGLSQEI